MEVRPLLMAALAASLALAAPALLGDDPPKGPWTGAAELSYVGTSGNTETQSIGFGGQLNYKPGVWNFDFKATYVEAETGGVKSAEKTTAIFAANRSLNPKLDYYARVGYLSDEFSGIDSNVTFDTGLAYKLLTGNAQFLDIGGGVGYTTESRTIGDDRDFASGSAFGKYKWKFTANAEFANDATFLLDFEDSENWRFLNSASVSAAINSRFSMKAYYNIVHLNAPVPGFEKTDSTTGVSLVAKF